MGEPNILHEDDAIIAVDKPSGLMVHAAPGASGPTLVEWLLQKYPELREVGEEGREGIVHRLDRETSGLLLIARTPHAHAELQRQFAEREVHKTYRAFAYGALKEERGIIDRPIGRTRGSGSSRSVKDPHGTLRPARTAFHTLGVGGAGEERASYLELFPETGRTHQLRVHLSSINHPVLCDERYAPGRPALLGFSRLALHALSLSFAHPRTGKRMVLTAPLPSDFLEAEKRLPA